jgi:hypothetical protein
MAMNKHVFVSRMSLCFGLTLLALAIPGVKTLAWPGNCCQNHLGNCCDYLCERVPCDPACPNCCGSLDRASSGTTYKVGCNLSSGYTSDSFYYQTSACCFYYAAHCEGSNCVRNNYHNTLNACFEPKKDITTSCGP